MDLMAKRASAAGPCAAGASRPIRNDIEARGHALYGAWLCGTVLGNVGMALHHKLCHTLGGSFNLPHAETHTIVLPHALAYNAPQRPEAMQRITRALGGSSAAQAVYDLAKANGAPVALKDIGMKQPDLDKACDIAMQNQYPNPRPLERDAIRALLQNAWEGVRP
jgi:maleylacetate reductase